MADDKITGKDLIDDSAFVRLEQLDTALAKILERFTQIEGVAQRAFSNNQLSAAARQTKINTDEANVALKEQERIEKNLVRQRERNRQLTSQTSRELIKQRVETQAATRELKRQATATSDTVGAYRRLSAQLNIAKDTLKDIIIEQGQFSDAARLQQREVDRLTTKIKSADNAAGDFQRNVGNYPTALRGAVNVIRQLVGVFGIVEGLRLGARFITDAAALSREARGVTFAFERLGEEGADALETTRRSVRRLISDLDLQRSLVELNNFNIGLERSDVLFEFLAIRAAQTGRSIESLRDSLVEGLSKESTLRIDNLGISVVALNEELEKTPNFVEAVANIAEREIAEAGRIIDDAADGAAKFNAAWTDLQVAIRDVANEVQGLGIFTQLIQNGTTNTRLWNELLIQNGDIVGFLGAVYNSTSREGQFQNQILLNEIENRRQVKKEIDEQINAYIRLNGSIGPLTEEQQRSADAGRGSLLFDPNAGKEIVLTLGDINDEIKRLNDELLKQTTRAGAQAIQEEIKALERQRDAILGVAEARTKQAKTQQLVVEVLDETSERSLTSTISSLERARSEVGIGTREWQEYTEAIKAVKEELSLLKQTFEDGIPELAEVEDDFEIFQEVQRFLNIDGIDQGLRSLADRLGTTQEELVKEFESLYERDFKNFLEYQERKLEAEQILSEQRTDIQLNSLSVAQDFAQAFFDVQSNRVEREIEAQNRAFDAIINGKNASEEQIRIAEQKREENEIRLEKEREKRQRKAFLVQQGIEVAKAVIQGAAAQAAALAPPPVGLGPVLGATLIPGITINTALAIGAILAQSIPAFFKGKTPLDRYSGPATVNELPGQREVGVNERGQVELFPAGMHVRNVKSGDIIIPSVPDFAKALGDPNTEVYKRVSKNVSRQSRERYGYKGLSEQDVRRIVGALQFGIKKGFNGIVINNSFAIPKDRRKY